MIDLGLRRGSANRTSTTHSKTFLNVQSVLLELTLVDPALLKQLNPGKQTCKWRNVSWCNL